MKYGIPVLDAVRASLKDFPDSPVFALLRHSERGPIVDSVSALLVPLTPDGESEAVEMGRALPVGYHLVLASSPVGRCLKTAELIAEGYRQVGGTVEWCGVYEDLGGPYVVDPTAVAIHADGMGKGFMAAWRSGQLGDQVIKPMHEACCSQFGVVKRHADRARPREIHMLVSHDWNVLTVREHLLGLMWEEHGWVDFLDGVVMRQEGLVWSLWTCGIAFSGISGCPCPVTDVP
jgi:hypothetical protein